MACCERSFQGSRDYDKDCYCCYQDVDWRSGPVAFVCCWVLPIPFFRILAIPLLVLVQLVSMMWLLPVGMLIDFCCAPCGECPTLQDWMKRWVVIGRLSVPDSSDKNHCCCTPNAQVQCCGVLCARLCSSRRSDGHESLLGESELPSEGGRVHMEEHRI